MQRQNHSDQRIQTQRITSDCIAQFKVWLSRESKHYGMYLTIKNDFVIIGSKEAKQKQDIIIQASDFIGYNQESIDEDWTKLNLNVFAKKKKLFQIEKRHLIQYPLYIYSEEFSARQLKQLKSHLLSIASNNRYRDPSHPPRLMIYFNPNAGSNSKKHFDRIMNFLSYTGFESDVLRTQKRNHCKEHINNELDLTKYHGIIIVSGDGLMHEFVNSKAVGVVPVTHVPAGSGNAFAKYQMTLAGEACEDQEAMFLAIKGRTKNFNLAEFNLQSLNQPIFSFLSFEWCFMADIDMNSEFLRFLGGLRFELYGLWRLLKIRRYHGKFSYSTTSTKLPSLSEQITDLQHFTTQEKTYLHKIITFIPWISTSYEISPLLNIEDEAMDMQKMSEDAGRLQLIKYMLNCESGNQFDRQKKTIKEGYNFEWDKIKSFRLEPNGDDVGVFGIDGEMYPAQKIQAKISDKKVLTFV